MSNIRGEDGKLMLEGEEWASIWNEYIERH